MQMYDASGPFTLQQYLESYTVDVLKPLAALCGCPKEVTRKAELIQCIEQTMTSPAGLQKMWDQLDDISRKAVSLAVHSGGEFDANAFYARHLQLPERPEGRSRWEKVAIPLDLFLHEAHVPRDVLPLLLPWVPRPEPYKLEGLAVAPQGIKIHGETIELLYAETERIGQQDLAALLRLIDMGHWRVSPSTLMPTAASVRKLLPLLSEGDFWPHPEDVKSAETIRPVGLSTFAIGSRLARLAGSSSGAVELTDAGRQ